MGIIVEDTCGSLAEKAAGVALAAMLRDKRVNVVITAGNSPVLTCQRVKKAIKANPAGFAHVRCYNFDEIPIKGQAKGVTMRELDRLFFVPAGMPASRIHPRFTLILDNDAASAL
jgi:6-phosphogluconolactonase/glucosamine-6-phosphate isomerase/deaminase